MRQPAFFYIWPCRPRATRWSSAFWQLAPGRPVQSKSGPCGHNTLSALWMIQLGQVQALPVPNGKWGLRPSSGSSAWGSRALRSYLPPKIHIQSELLGSYSLLLPTNHGHFQSPRTLPLGFQLLGTAETLYFYVCLAEIYSSGRGKSHCLLGDFTSTHYYYYFFFFPHSQRVFDRGWRNRPASWARPQEKGRLWWQQPVHNLPGLFLF